MALTTVLVLYYAIVLFQGVQWCAACGETYNKPTGIISTPNYGSSNYPTNLNCLWTIRVPKACLVTITVIAFEVEGCFDPVYIEDQYTSQRYCGTELVGSVTQKGETLVRMTSDPWTSKPGFKLSFMVHCKLARIEGGTYNSHRLTLLTDNDNTTCTSLSTPLTVTLMSAMEFQPMYSVLSFDVIIVHGNGVIDVPNWVRVFTRPGLLLDKNKRSLETVIATQCDSASSVANKETVKCTCDDYCVVYVMFSHGLPPLKLCNIILK